MNKELQEEALIAKPNAWQLASKKYPKSASDGLSFLIISDLLKEKAPATLYCTLLKQPTKKQREADKQRDFLPIINATLRKQRL
jgi:hypothetical protein